MSQAVYASNGLAGISLLAQVRIHMTNLILTYSATLDYSTTIVKY